MSTEKPFALVKRRHGEPVSGWAVFAIGRETPQRVYEFPANARCWNDPYYSKSDVVARFDTKDEALAFKAAVLDVWNAFKDRVEAAEEAVDASRRSRRALVELRDAALKAHLEAQAGPKEDPHD